MRSTDDLAVSIAMPRCNEGGVLTVQNSATATTLLTELRATFEARAYGKPN